MKKTRVLGQNKGLHSYIKEQWQGNKGALSMDHINEWTRAQLGAYKEIIHKSLPVYTYPSLCLWTGRPGSANQPARSTHLLLYGQSLGANSESIRTAVNDVKHFHEHWGKKIKLKPDYRWVGFITLYRVCGGPHYLTRSLFSAAWRGQIHKYGC